MWYISEYNDVNNRAMSSQYYDIILNRFYIDRQINLYEFDFLEYISLIYNFFYI